MDSVSQDAHRRHRVSEDWNNRTKKMSSRSLAWVTIFSTFCAGIYAGIGIMRLIHGPHEYNWVPDILFALAYLGAGIAVVVALVTRARMNHGF